MQLAFDLAAARKNESKIKVRRLRVQELRASYPIPRRQNRRKRLAQTVSD